MPKVIIVDDHTLFRLGVKGALAKNSANIKIVGEADCGEALFQLLDAIHPDIILLDLHLPDMSEIEIITRLRREYSDIKILVISAENTADTIEPLLEIGIDGFISKQQSTATELPEAITTIMNGMEYFGKDIAAIIYKVYISKKKTAKITSEFTEREQEIINLCHCGLQSKEIADRLHISPRTVETHKNNIFKKLGINNTMEMVRYAMEHGIIEMT